MVPQITKRFGSSYEAQLSAKTRIFWKRDVWLYCLAGLLLAWALPTLIGNFWGTWLTLALGFCSLGYAVIYLGSHLQRHKQVFQATVEFQPAQISVLYADPNRPPETKDWTWIISSEETEAYFFLLIRRLPRLEIRLPKHSLTPEEVVAFRTWLAQPK